MGGERKKVVTESSNNVAHNSNYTKSRLSKLPLEVTENETKSTKF